MNKIKIFIFFAGFLPLAGFAAEVEAFPKPAGLDAELFDAISKKDIEKARAAIEAGADINAQDEEGFRPIHRAVLSKNLEMLYLVGETKGVDLTIKAPPGVKPSYIGMKLGVLVAKLIGRPGGLVPHKPKKPMEGDEPVFFTVIKNQLEMLKYFDEKGLVDFRKRSRIYYHMNLLELAEFGEYVMIDGSSSEIREYLKARKAEMKSRPWIVRLFKPGLLPPIKKTRANSSASIEKAPVDSAKSPTQAAHSVDPPESEKPKANSAGGKAPVNSALLPTRTTYPRASQPSAKPLPDLLSLQRLLEAAASGDKERIQESAKREFAAFDMAEKEMEAVLEGIRNKDTEVFSDFDRIRREEKGAQMLSIAGAAALYYAFGKGDYDMIQRLGEKDILEAFYPLEGLEGVIPAGEDFNLEIRLFEALSEDNEKEARAALEKIFNLSAPDRDKILGFFKVIQKGDAEMLNIFLAQTANIGLLRRALMPLLRFAVYKGDAEKIQHLIYRNLREAFQAVHNSNCGAAF